MRTYEIIERFSDEVFDRVYKEGRSFVYTNLGCRTARFRESYGRGYRTLLIQGACAGCEEAAYAWISTGDMNIKGLHVKGCQCGCEARGLRKKETVRKDE